MIKEKQISSLAKGFTTMLVILIVFVFALGFMFSGDLGDLGEVKKTRNQSQNDWIGLANENLRLTESDSIQEIKIYQLQRELDFLKKQLIPLNELKREIDSFKKIGGIDSV